MALIVCPECGAGISEKAIVCPRCGCPMKEEAAVPQPAVAQAPAGRRVRGFEWKSKAQILGWPLIHVAIGRNKETGRLMVARGIIAIGQFGIGLVTIAQFGVGVLFGFGQFVTGAVAVGQVAVGIYFGLGQVATGTTAIGQFALGKYVLAQLGAGKHVWTTKIRDVEAIKHFQGLWDSTKGLLGW